MMHINKASRTDMRMLKEVRRFHICVQCKHYQNKICHNFMSINLVDGHEEAVMAVDARYRIDLCGPGGAYFKPIDTQKAVQLNPPNLLPEH
jgi:hypothetical protein